MCLCSISSDAMFKFSFLAVKDYPHGFPCDGWEIFTKRKSSNWRENEVITFYWDLVLWWGFLSKCVFAGAEDIFFYDITYFPPKPVCISLRACEPFMFKSILICITFYEIFKLIRIPFLKVGFKGWSFKLLATTLCNLDW